jgi:hypothetical protein
MKKKSNLRDTEIRKILERTPMTERLEESERIQMRRDFLQSIQRERSSSRVQAGRGMAKRGVRSMWVGGGLGALAFCALLLFLLFGPGLPPAMEGYYPEFFEKKSQDHHIYLNWDNPADKIYSSTEEVEASTVEIEVPTRTLLNQVPSESLCGPRSAWVAAARNGQNLDLGKLVRDCHLSARGCSLLDLKRALGDQGVESEGWQLSWEDLLKHKTPTILFVDGNHFCCVDPAERQGDLVRMYDSPKPGQWVGRSDLVPRWKGQALVLAPSNPVPSETGALAFETILNDFGSVYDQDSILISFPFQNLGGETLTIREVQSSCGCLEAQSNVETLEPGESGEVSVLVSLQEEGPLHQMIEVVTDSPATPSTTLVVQGTSARSYRLDRDHLDFGVLSLGSEAEKSVQVSALHGGPVSIQDVRFSIEGDPLEAPVLSSDFEKNSPIQPSVSTSVGLAASIAKQVPLGDLKGEVEFHLATPGGIQTERIPFTLTVVPEFEVVPDHISFGVVRPGEEIGRNVVLRKHTRDAFSITDAVVKTESGRVSVSASPASGAGEEVPVFLSMNIPELGEEEAALARGEVVVSAGSGREVRIPWSAIVKKGE